MWEDIDALYTEEGWKKFVSSVKQGICLSGRIINELVNDFDIVVDNGYEDFNFACRWTIGKYYILNIDGDYYRVWEDVGLTEMQSSDFYDQVAECVEEREITITEWYTKGE